MTLKERVIVETLTGYCMTRGQERDELFKYMGELLGRPVFAHELGIEEIQKQLKEKALPDFRALCLSEAAWSEAKKNIWELLPHYLASNYDMAKHLGALMERYNNGERTLELYDLMMEAYL